MESTVRYKCYFSSTSVHHLGSKSTPDKHNTMVFKVMAVKLTCSLDDKVLSSTNVPIEGSRISGIHQRHKTRHRNVCTVVRTVVHSLKLVCMYNACLYVWVYVRLTKSGFATTLLNSYSYT